MKSKPTAMKSKPDATKSKPGATKSKFPNSWIHRPELIFFNVLQRTPNQDLLLALALAALHPAKCGFEPAGWWSIL
jgi:hypothetical protein